MREANTRDVWLYTTPDEVRASWPVVVDLYFLDRKQLTVEAALPAALQKDAGVDPAMLSLLLKDFPTAPLPVMLEPLTEAELARFRNDLVERFRAVALPPP